MVLHYFGIFMNFLNLSLILSILTNVLISTTYIHATSQDDDNDTPQRIEPAKKRVKTASRTSSLIDLATQMTPLIPLPESAAENAATSAGSNHANLDLAIIPRDLSPYQNLFVELRSIDALVHETRTARGTSEYLGKIFQTTLKLYRGNWIEWLRLDNLTRSIKSFIANDLGDLIKDDYRELNALLAQNSQTFPDPQELLTSVYLTGCGQLLSHTLIYQVETDDQGKTRTKYGFRPLKADAILKTKSWLLERISSSNNNHFDYNAATLLFILLDCPILIASNSSTNDPSTLVEGTGNIVETSFVDQKTHDRIINLAKSKKHRGIIASNLELEISFADGDPNEKARINESYKKQAQTLIDLGHPLGHIFMGNLLAAESSLKKQAAETSDELADKAMLEFLRAYELKHPESYGPLSKIYNGIYLGDRFYNPQTSFRVLEEASNLGLDITPFFLIHTLINLHECPADGVAKILEKMPEITPPRSPLSKLIRNLMYLRLYVEDPTTHLVTTSIGNLLALHTILTADNFPAVTIMNEEMPMNALSGTTYFMIWQAYENAITTPGAHLPDITEARALYALALAAKKGHKTASRELQILETVSALRIDTQTYTPLRESYFPMTQPRLGSAAATPQESLRLQLELLRDNAAQKRKLNVWSALSLATGLEQNLVELIERNTPVAFQLTVPPITAQHLVPCFQYAYAKQRLDEMAAARPQTVVNLNTMQKDPFRPIYAIPESAPMSDDAWAALQTNLSNLLEMDEREKDLRTRFFNFMTNDPVATSLKGRLERVYKQLLPVADAGKRKALACLLMLDGGQACINRALEALAQVEGELTKELSPDFNTTLPAFVGKVLAQLRSKTAADIALLPGHAQNVEERRYYRIILEPFISPIVHEPNLQYHLAAINCYGPYYTYAHFLRRLTASVYIDGAHAALKTKLPLIASHLESHPPEDLKTQLETASTAMEKQRLIWNHFATEDYDDVRKDFIEKLLLDLKYLSADPYY